MHLSTLVKHANALEPIITPVQITQLLTHPDNFSPYACQGVFLSVEKAKTVHVR